MNIKKTLKTISILGIISLSLGLTACNKAEKKVPQTPAQVLAEDFKSTIASNESIELEELAAHLIGNEIIEFAPIVMPVEPGYLNGFSSEVTGFNKGAIFAPMIGSIPFIGYVFHVDGNVETFVNSLKEKADLRWNVCTQADEMVTEIHKKTVFFVMAPLSFDED